MPGNPSLQHLSYAYDDNGNVTSLTDLKAGSQVQTFTYDALDRLDSAQVTASGDGNGVYGLSDFTYDTYGRLRNNPNPGMGALSYLDSDHINAATHVGGENPSDQRYWYDANGNMTTRKAGGLTYTLTYDAENRLTGVSQGGTTIATFVYDGDGSRVKGTVSGATTYYVGGHFEWTGSTSTMKRYIYAGGQRAGVLDGNAIYYLLSDQLGSTSVSSSYNGTKVAEVRYYPFGSDRYSTGNAHTSFRFTGQRVEDYIKLVLMGSRWYDPAYPRSIARLAPGQVAQLGQYLAALWVSGDAGAAQVISQEVHQAIRAGVVAMPHSNGLAAGVVVPGRGVGVAAPLVVVADIGDIGPAPDFDFNPGIAAVDR